MTKQATATKVCNLIHFKLNISKWPIKSFCRYPDTPILCVNYRRIRYQSWYSNAMEGEWVYHCCLPSTAGQARWGTFAVYRCQLYISPHYKYNHRECPKLSGTLLLSSTQDRSMLCTFDRFAQWTNCTVLSADCAALLMDRALVHQSVNSTTIDRSQSNRLMMHASRLRFRCMAELLDQWVTASVHKLAKWPLIRPIRPGTGV